MKKICSLILALLLCVGVFAGCSDTGPDTEESSSSVISSQVEEPESEVSAPESSAVSEVSEVSEDSEASEVSEVSEVEVLYPAEEASGDLPFEIVETSVESPAAIGEWVMSKKYSPVDDLYHNVYYRVTNVVRGAQDYVDAYNAEGHVVSLSDLDDENLEYCMIEYEVYFPEDFPQRDFGITDIEVDFGIENPEGGGFDYNGVTYIGLGSVWDISDDPETDTFFAGDTFTEGKAIFAMLKDFDGYIFESYYRENDESVYSYVEGM